MATTPSLFDQKTEQELLKEEALEKLKNSTSDNASPYGTVLYSWTATNDYGAERNANWAAAMIFLQVVFALGALIFSQWIMGLLVLGTTVLTVLLLWYPSKQSENILTSLGIVIAGKLKKWSEIRSFHLQVDKDHVMVVLTPRNRFGLSDVVFIDDQDHEEILTILTTYLPMEDLKEPLLEMLLERLGAFIRSLWSRLPLTGSRS